jgi:outer membrane lipoprotein carrier protein
MSLSHVLALWILSASNPANSTGTKAEMPPEVRALVDRMQAFYEKTKDFTADFRQVYVYQSSGRTQTSTGKVTFLKPAMMRWDYLSPSPKSFVLSGDKVYAFDPEAMTLTIGTLGSNQLSTSVTFLMGKGRLETEFQISRIPCSTCRGTVLELAPLKKDPRFQKVELEVEPKSAQVLKSTVTDIDGSKNAIEFKDLKVNQGVAKEQFKLKPPEGTQIIDLTKQPP